MRSKKKLSVTIDAEVLEAVDRAARECRIGKSRLAQEAFTLWLRKRTGQLMAEGYAETAKEDGETAEATFDAQKETIQ